MKIDPIKKDTVAKLVILYILPLLFWFSNRNSIYTSFDMYLFIVSLFIMFIIPIIFLLLNHNINIDGGG